MLSCATFDLDDTLWEVDPVIRRANDTLWQWLDRHGGRFTALHTPADLVEGSKLRAALLEEYPEIAHHTIWLGQRYRELLDEIFNSNALPEDFSLYLHRPTATDPSFAPKGCESFYVLAPVPNLNAGIDWKTNGPLLRQRIIGSLSEHMLPDLEKHLVTDFYMTPEDFKKDYLSVGGAGFSVAPLFTQSAWFRFHNKAEGPENLYLVGAGTHPGAGLPGVVSSAKVLDRLVPEVASSPIISAA